MYHRCWIRYFFLFFVSVFPPQHTQNARRFIFLKQQATRCCCFHCLAAQRRLYLLGWPSPPLHKKLQLSLKRESREGNRLQTAAWKHVDTNQNRLHSSDLSQAFVEDAFSIKNLLSYGAQFLHVCPRPDQNLFWAERSCVKLTRVRQRSTGSRTWRLKK